MSSAQNRAEILHNTVLNKKKKEQTPSWCLNGETPLINWYICHSCNILYAKLFRGDTHTHAHKYICSLLSTQPNVRACLSLITNGSMLGSLDKSRQKDQFRWSMKVISNDIYEYFMEGRECHHKFLYKEMRQEYKTNSIKHWTWPPCQKDCV